MKIISTIEFNSFNKLISTKIVKNKIPIGYTKSSIINYKTGNINKIYVLPEYRKQNYGSLLLKTTEKILKNNFNINKINILVWNRIDTNVLLFYQKNGYYETNDNINTYDDGVNIYDLINVTKSL